MRPKATCLGRTGAGSEGGLCVEKDRPPGCGRRFLSARGPFLSEEPVLLVMCRVSRPHTRWGIEKEVVREQGPDSGGLRPSLPAASMKEPSSRFPQFSREAEVLAGLLLWNPHAPLGGWVGTAWALSPEPRECPQDRSCHYSASDEFLCTERQGRAWRRGMPGRACWWGCCYLVHYLSPARRPGTP